MTATKRFLVFVLAGLTALAAAVPTEALDLRSWDRKFDNASTRFTVLSAFDDEAVLDKETQLVWQRQPDPTFRPWAQAIAHCMVTPIGGRLGWRLPTFEELSSLLVAEQPGLPGLPAGHPFLNLPSGLFYWSATTSATDVAAAWSLKDSPAGAFIFTKSADRSTWCVRGGQGYDGR